MGVYEFAIGMGPKLLSRKSKKTGIRYSLRLFPIGGFVNLVGEDEKTDREDALNKKSWYKRFLIIAAGSLTNILCAIVVMFTLLLFVNNYPTTTVSSYELEHSVLYSAGIREGDVIREINGRKITVYSELSYAILHDGVNPVDITVQRDGETLLFRDIRFQTEKDQIEIGVIDFFPTFEQRSAGTLLKQSFFQSFAMVKMIYESLVDLISGRYGIDAVSGPVGTVGVIADSVDTGAYHFFYLFVFISMNLGVFNLLPFPALDGGRLFFILLEALRGKPVKPEHEGYVHLAGMALLLLFMAFITVFDILKLVR